MKNRQDRISHYKFISNYSIIIIMKIIYIIGLNIGLDRKMQYDLDKI